MPRLPLTKEIVNHRLIDRQIQLVSKYINNETKSTFQCINGHKWVAIVRNVLWKNGCPHCANRFPKTTSEVNEKLKARNIWMLDSCTGMQTRSTFECSEGHQWIATPNSVIRGNGCPSCATYGFNKSNPAYGYLIKFDTHIKFGIANNLKSRLKKHKRHGEYEIIKVIQFDVGADAIAWEKSIKMKFGGSYMKKNDVSDGFTETLSLKHIKSIMEDMDEHVY